MKERLRFRDASWSEKLSFGTVVYHMTFVLALMFLCTILWPLRVVMKHEPAVCSPSGRLLTAVTTQVYDKSLVPCGILVVITTQVIIRISCGLWYIIVVTQVYDKSILVACGILFCPQVDQEFPLCFPIISKEQQGPRRGRPRGCCRCYSPSTYCLR